ncbi:MAG: ribosome-associated translation inhibitor RaiA [Kiloniellales bacterium]|nr:ribosome-associated translation inhibitor RaiA [Kiloniellales bacterium]
MQLSVKGKQLDVGDALRSHIEDSLERTLSKYFGNVIEAHVTVSREAHLYRATVSAHVGRHIQLAAQGDADDPYRACDSALDRLSKRLRRHKRRLRDHHKEPGNEHETLSAQQYILAAEDGAEAESEEAGPAVVAEMVTEIPSLTVSEAVMRMDLAELPAMMFRNDAHGGLNMIYRRDDGTIGWVDPRGNRSA